MSRVMAEVDTQWFSAAPQPNRTRPLRKSAAIARFLSAALSKFSIASSMPLRLFLIFVPGRLCHYSSAS
jgi:hypothetical protein